MTTPSSLAALADRVPYSQCQSRVAAEIGDRMVRVPYCVEYKRWGKCACDRARSHALKENEG